VLTSRARIESRRWIEAVRSALGRRALPARYTHRVELDEVCWREPGEAWLMNHRRYFLYPVPDDTGTLLAVVNSLSGDDETEFGWIRLHASLVAVSTITAAIYLRTVYSYRPTDITGASLLEHHEVWVDDEDRPECERMLVENCPCQAQWFDLIQISFTDDDEHRTFAAAYSRITGLPNPFSPVPTRAE
jgi:hypothetical protein